MESWRAGASDGCAWSFTCYCEMTLTFCGAGGAGATTAAAAFLIGTFTTGNRSLSVFTVKVSGLPTGIWNPLGKVTEAAKTLPGWVALITA
jgi:hypothetical protein